MTAAAADRRLLEEVKKGNMQGVEESLAAGASPNGPRRASLRPLMHAARWGSVGIARRLVEAGADPEATVTADAGGFEGRFFPVGSRALHAAISFGVEVGMIKVLLDGGANPDPPDIDGCTPLANACSLLDPDERLAIARELLKGGANPFCKTFKGTTPLHFAASKGDCRMLELLLSAAPDMLNAVNDDHGTPMAFAASTGQDQAVSFLLEAGASDEAILEYERSSLFMAVARGFRNVVRVLLSEKGVKALGGTAEISHAICCVIQQGQVKTLDMLLSVEGTKRRKVWANRTVVVPGRLSDRKIELGTLECAAAYGCLASTHVLLAAGANENLVGGNNSQGNVNPLIGLMLDREDKDPKKAGEIRRALKRGPAYRARSWRWPRVVSSTSGETSAGDDAQSDPLEGAAPLAVRVFRPTNGLFFTTRLERYAKK